MRCSNCGTDNPPANNFCAHCGNALVRLCSKCAAENPPTSNFCGKCGAPLTAIAELATGQPLQAPLVGPAIRVTPELAEGEDKVFDVDGERKTVSALFADLKGSTELIRDLDPAVA